MKKKLVNFFLTEAQHLALRRVARQQGRTVSEIMRRSIDDLITRDLAPPARDRHRPPSPPVS